MDSVPPARGAIAAGHRLTAEAGAEVLRRGGNAVDAAIAALAMACVCEPVLCSPGGGGFAAIRSADGDVRLIDFFPHTPCERRSVGDDDGVWPIVADFGTATQEFHIGPATAATPGFVPGLHAMSAHGASPLSELLDPAIAAARSGVTVTAFQHFLSTVVGPILLATPAARELFAPDGDLLAAGSILRNPGLADALASIGSEAGYSPTLAEAIVDQQADGGHLTAEDLATYQVEERTPTQLDIDGSTVHLNPLPAASGVLITHSIQRSGAATPGALAAAFAETSRDRAAANGELAALADLPVRPRGTTHISVIDSEGTTCAVTTSNGEGNGVIVDDFGFMLNNVLGEVDVNPAGTGDWPRNTRLSSMMSPTIVERPDGSVVAMGSGGSNRIRTAIAQVVLALCRGDATLVDAVMAPRLHVEGTHLDFEDFFDDADRAELVAAFPDHQPWPERNLFYGGVHAVSRDANGRFAGVGDPRRDGTALIVTD